MTSLLIVRHRTTVPARAGRRGRQLDEHDAPILRVRNVRSGETAFIEIFSWRDDKASNLAHQTPEVMAVWEPMTPMLEHLEINVIEPVGG